MPASHLSTLRFAAIVSLICSILVTGSAVLLRERQEANRLLARRVAVLEVAGLIRAGERLDREEVDRRYERSVRPIVIRLVTGERAPEIDVGTFDPGRAARDPEASRPAPANRAGVERLAEYSIVFHVLGEGEVRSIILPIEGKGLWSTLRGFIALSADTRFVDAIDFYEHAETPGLGSGIEEPSWRARWVGRRAFDDDWQPRVEVIKGPAPPPAEAPYQVDGLAGATLTGRSVTHLVRFWLGAQGFGPYLARYREEVGIR